MPAESRDCVLFKSDSSSARVIGSFLRCLIQRCVLRWSGQKRRKETTCCVCVISAVSVRVKLWKWTVSTVSRAPQRSRAQPGCSCLTHLSKVKGYNFTKCQSRYDVAANIKNICLHRSTSWRQEAVSKRKQPNQSLVTKYKYFFIMFFFHECLIIYFMYLSEHLPLSFLHLCFHFLQRKLKMW